MFKQTASLLAVAFGVCLPLQAAEPTHKILFFSKSSGYEHEVISYKKGQPSFAEKIFLDLGGKHPWQFEFSKDGSKFSPEYLAGFDAVIFYTTGDLTQPGSDKNPPMTKEGKQALFDYVKGGKGFIGLHSATDTFHTPNPTKVADDNYNNHGKEADPYICFIGAEFIKHDSQQKAENKVIDKKFPGFEEAGDTFTFNEEWYSLKDFSPDLHVLTVINAPAMTGPSYNRPAYPTTWARKEGKGRVFYTAMGHRDDIWTNPTFQNILVGAIHWTTGDVDADIPPNLLAAAPGAMTNPPVPPPAPPKPAPAPAPVPAPEPVPAK
jgi:type 1 glutamine amidotransferase